MSLLLIAAFLLWCLVARLFPIMLTAIILAIGAAAYSAFGEHEMTMCVGDLRVIRWRARSFLRQSAERGSEKHKKLAGAQKQENGVC
jgi:hypothetical protein